MPKTGCPGPVFNGRGVNLWRLVHVHVRAYAAGESD